MAKKSIYAFLLYLVVLFLLFPASLWPKSVYIPQKFSTSPWNEWSPDNKYESANFVVFWGAKVGPNPQSYPDSSLRFDPAAICNYLELSFTKYVSELGFVSNTGNLGTYKIIVVMNETYNGSGGPTGWAFGGHYDDVIGAIWIHPNATRDAYVLAHEVVHSLQYQNRIQQNTAGGFVNYEPAGWFWEAHANYMRCLQYPETASEDMPRWLATRSFHLSSTRHHYSAFRWLMNIQANYGGVNQVNALWKESLANETPITALARLKGWNQSQLNDFMYDTAKREVAFDYPSQGFGSRMADLVDSYRTGTSNNHYLWRYYTILSQTDSSSERYIVPDFAAPQDYGFNIIPLYPTCPNRIVHVKFKGHTEVNATAGWRWGFVAVKHNGTDVTYGIPSASDEGEAVYEIAPDDESLYLVVMGAPTSRTDYVWEPGWPKIKRYPYELRIENAIPEGYQSDFRSDIKTLYPGRAHSNGGGWVANTASVAASVYVGPKAVVLGSSNLSGSVRVDGTARIENTSANSNVVFDGNVNVRGGTYSDTAHITDAAILNNCTVSGNTIIKGNAMEWDETFGGNNVVVGGDAEIESCSTAGVYLQCPHSNNGRSECDGRGVGDSSNADVNASYSVFPDSVMAWTPIGCNDATPTGTSAAPGDVNSSGTIDIVDALLTAQYYVGLPVSNFNTAAADVTGNGTIDIVDALRIAQCYVGLITCDF
ncbi:MAG: hypothetical protein JW881_16410 [Spirochaetales bacterium]|nr:hypothetical protein [Spirochaetales bacterium]